MRMSKLRTTAALSLIGLGMLAAPGTAQAWRHYGPHWYGGIYVAPPVYVAPPPVYVAPPVYAPYYPPPAQYAGPPAASVCSAGPYVCPLAAPANAGQSCACDTAQGRFWGTTR